MQIVLRQPDFYGESPRAAEIDVLDGPPNIMMVTEAPERLRAEE